MSEKENKEVALRVPGITKYDQVVMQAREMINKTRMRLLSCYWEIGKMALEAIKPEYGQHTTEKFADDIGLERTTVYATIQFVRAYPTKEALIRVSERGLAWSHIRALLGSKVDEETRDRLERKVQESRMGVAEFTEMVRKEVGRSKQPIVKTPDTPLGVFIKIGKMVERLLAILPEFKRALIAANKMESGEDKAETLGTAKETRDLLGDLYNMLEGMGLKCKNGK